MTTSGPALPIRSLTEARLYLQVTTCRACGAGPLITDPHAADHDPHQHTLNVPVTCKACGQRCDVLFDTSEVQQESMPANPTELLAPAGPAPASAINPADEPSRIIDVAGWLTLYSTIADAARARDAEAQTMRDRAAIRLRRIEAAQCLDEALKFFDADNDLPPEDAFFHDDTRRRFRDHPELFTRQHLIDLRRQLPR